MANTLAIELPPFPPCGPDETWVQVTEGEALNTDMCLWPSWKGGYGEWHRIQVSNSKFDLFTYLIRRVKIDPRDARIKDLEAAIAWKTGMAGTPEEVAARVLQQHKEAKAEQEREAQAVKASDAELEIEALKADLRKADVARGRLRVLLIDEVCFRLGVESLDHARGKCFRHNGLVVARSKGDVTGVSVDSIEGRAILRSIHGPAAQKIVAEMLGESK